MTKYVVSGYIGFDNFGDEAIAGVLSEHLKTIGAEKITLISSNPEKTSAMYGVESVGMFKFISAIKECDILISGGGSLLQDITSMKSLIYYLLVILFALLYGKKVFIFAQGFSNFRTKTGYFLTKLILKQCHYVSVRDKKSQDILQEMGIKSELIPDPIFGINVPHKEHYGIGIQLRGFKTITDEFLNTLADNLQRCFENKEIRLISLQDKIDLYVLEKFSDILKTKGMKSIILKELSVKQAVEAISSLEYLVGMRFHSCLIGAKAGVKVLGINYDQKVQQLSKDVQFPIIEIENNLKSENFDKIFEISAKNYFIPQSFNPQFK